MTLLDDEGNPLVTYTYSGARAAGATQAVTAGDPPKTLTRDVTLLGARHGAGTASYPNGDTYEGQYVDGARHGAGLYVYAAQPPAEEGEEPKPPMAVYDGRWKAGMRSGLGTMTYASGEKYQGSFVDGKYGGQGTMFYANGDIYTGAWAAGKRHGKGTYIAKATGGRTAGTWEAGVPTTGSFIDQFANAYEGGFNPMGPTRVAYGAGAFTLASGASCPAPPASRLVLYASDTPDKADFVLSLLPGVTAVEYDVETATEADLVGLIGVAMAVNGGPFESIALACHGDGAASGFAWSISKKLVVTEAAAIDSSVVAVMQALGRATAAGGRVDLFACSLLATDAGSAIFAQIQRATETHFAASDDLTGNARGQGLQDWVMESDGVNVKPLYFGDTSAFDGHFGDGEGMNIRKELFEKMCKQMSKNGDGDVTKSEFELVYTTMEPTTTKDKFVSIWNDIADSDGNLSAQELASYFGFAWDDGTTSEMTDQQILLVLDMYGVIQDLQIAPPKAMEEKEVNAKDAKKRRDETVITIHPTGSQQNKDIANVEEMIALDEALHLSEFSIGCELLLDTKLLNVRFSDEQGETPLHKLARAHVTEHNYITFKDCFNKLIEAYTRCCEAAKKKLVSDVNAADKQGKTPLFHAVEKKNLRMISMLYGLGTNGPDSLLVNSVGNGWTILHAATDTNETKTIEAIFKHLSTTRKKVLLATKDKTGRTPLDIASSRDPAISQPVLKLLIENGASNDIANDIEDGKRPSQLAERTGRGRR